MPKKQKAQPSDRAPEPGEWVCSKCGTPGGRPLEGLTLLDPRYAVGSCPAACVGRVQLVIGSSFNRRSWSEQARWRQDQELFDKMVRGAPMTDTEKKRAQAVRERILGPS